MRMSSVCIAVDTDKFIDELRLRPAIWTPESEAFSRAVAWNEMTNIFGLSTSVLKQKWKHLRDIFRREFIRNSMRKGRPVRSPQDFTGKWQFFGRLWEVCESTRQTCNIESKLSANDESEQENEVSGAQEPPELSASDEEAVEEERIVEPKSKRLKRVKLEQFTAPFEVEVMEDNSVEDSKEKYKLPIPEVKTEAPGNSEDYELLYLKSLLPYLRMLNPMRRLYIRNVFQELLYKELEGSGHNP